MIKYLLLIYGNEAAMLSASKAEADRMMAAYVAYTEAMRKAGVLVGGERLRPTAAASAVRVRDDKTQVLDGPYAETKEQLGGYYMIDVPDLDAALSWAARTGDVAGAEDALSEAFAAALIDWSASGIPEKPEAWLMAVARRKTIDAARRRHSGEDATDHLQLMAEELAAASDTDIPDDRLRLMFACAHPAIDPASARR